MNNSNQTILVGAKTFHHACEIAKRAGITRSKFTYVYNRSGFLNTRNAILLLDGEGDYSFYNDMDPYHFELDRFEQEGRITTILITPNQK